MTDRLPSSAALQAGRTYWIAVPPEGPPIVPTESADLLATNMQAPFFPLPGASLTHLGGLTVKTQGMTVGSMTDALRAAWGVSDVAIVDAGWASSLLGLVVSGYATQEDLYKLRDEVLKLGRNTIGWTATIVEWLPWIIAGAAVVGLAVILIVEVRS